MSVFAVTLFDKENKLIYLKFLRKKFVNLILLHFSSFDPSIEFGLGISRNQINFKIKKENLENLFKISF